VSAAAPGVQDLRSDQLREVSEWLAALYREPGRYWSRWQPERLAETHPSVLEPAEARPALAPVAAVATEEQMVNALTVRARAMVDRLRELLRHGFIASLRGQLA
jgi:hypothetical protein